MNNQILSNFS